MSDPNTSQLAANADRPDSPFDRIKQVRPDGTEYWSARALQGLMGYERWERMRDTVARAQQAASNAGDDVDTHFRGAAKVSGSRGPAREDFELTRHAAYLVAMNGDPRKPEVAAAQQYFAVRTHQAEVIQQEHDDLPEWARQQIATIRRVGKIEVEQEMQRERLSLVEGRLDGIEGRHDWFTALAYAKVAGLPTSQRLMAELGRTAARLCKRDGVTPEKTQDQRFGEVGVYPKDILAEAASLVRNAA